MYNHIVFSYYKDYPAMLYIVAILASGSTSTIYSNESTGASYYIQVILSFPTGTSTFHLWSQTHSGYSSHSLVIGVVLYNT